MILCKAFPLKERLSLVTAAKLCISATLNSTACISVVAKLCFFFMVTFEYIQTFCILYMPKVMQWNKAAVSLLELEVLVKNMAKITLLTCNVLSSLKLTKTNLGLSYWLPPRGPNAPRAVTTEVVTEQTACRLHTPLITSRCLIYFSIFSEVLSVYIRCYYLLWFCCASCMCYQIWPFTFFNLAIFITYISIGLPPSYIYRDKCLYLQNFWFASLFLYSLVQFLKEIFFKGYQPLMDVLLPVAFLLYW